MDQPKISDGATELPSHQNVSRWAKLIADGNANEDIAIHDQFNIILNHQTIPTAILVHLVSELHQLAPYKRLIVLGDLGSKSWQDINELSLALAKQGAALYPTTQPTFRKSTVDWKEQYASSSPSFQKNHRSRAVDPVNTPNWDLYQRNFLDAAKIHDLLSNDESGEEFSIIS